MISLVFFIAVIILLFLLNAWVTAAAARRAGSPRGRFGVGLIAVALILLVNIFVAAVAGRALGALALAVFSLQLAAIFFIFRGLFRLTAARTFAPFGIYIGLNIVQLIL